MRYKLLGRSGLRVAEFCLGTMTFGEDWGWGASKEVSRQIFDAYVSAGGNFIDTSANYTNGTSERFVGEFIAGNRDYFAVATKYTLRRPGAVANDLNGGGNARKNMVRSVEGSLQRLDTDYLDLLYLHMWDYSTPIDEILRGLDDLVRAGKVLYIGISDTPAWIAARAQMMAELRGWSQFVAYQGEYNLLERGIERDVLPMSRTIGLSVLAFSLLAGGALTGKFNTGAETVEGTRAGQASAAEKAAAAAIMAIAAEMGQSPSQVAINWVRQQAAHVIPILGARRLAQMTDNLGAADFTLAPEHLQQLNALKPLPTDYPHSFWNDFVRRDLIYGERVDQLDPGRWPA